MDKFGQQEKDREVAEKRFGQGVIAKRSRKQTQSEGQRGQWSAVYLFFLTLLILAVLALSCSTQDLLIVACGISMQTLSCGMWDLVPSPGIKPRPPALGAWGLRLDHSFWLWKVQVRGLSDLVFIHPGGLLGCWHFISIASQVCITKFTESVRWSSFSFKNGVSLVRATSSFPSSNGKYFLNTEKLGHV